MACGSGAPDAEGGDGIAAGGGALARFCVVS